MTRENNDAWETFAVRTGTAPRIVERLSSDMVAGKNSADALQVFQPAVTLEHTINLPALFRGASKRNRRFENFKEHST